jgi:hypothetical protein
MSPLPSLASHVCCDAAELRCDFGLIATWRTVKSRGPEIVRQSCATIKRARRISQASVTVRLVEQCDGRIAPFFWVHRFAAVKVRHCIFVFTELPEDSASRTKNCLRWSEFHDLGQIIKSTPRLTHVAPGEMPPEIGVKIVRILLQPFIHNLEVMRQIRSSQLMECEHFVR